MKFKFLDKELIPALTELQKEIPIEINEEGISLKFNKWDKKEITVKKSGDMLVVHANSKVHFFLGISNIILRQYDNESLEFTLKNSFSYNGIMVDNSRNGVASLPMVKRILRKMALLGHNWYMLYMEDVYEIKEQPYFGWLRGRYTVDELKELDEYASLLGIELVPCIQTLAHLNQFFHWEHIEIKYQDIEDILNVGKEDTLLLIEQMIASLRNTFSTNKIHIGMDEAWELGRGKYLDENGLKDKKDIMLNHLEKLVDICGKYDFEPIIWDDMFFSSYSSIEGDKDFKIPNEVGLMYWDYYSLNKEHYKEKIRQRKRVAAETLFAGGAWRWTGYTPHHLKTLKSSLAALKTCKEENIDKVIVTTWGDDGNECPLYNCLFGLTLYSYLGHHEKYDEIQFDKLLTLITGNSYEEWITWGKFDLIEGLDEEIYIDVNPSKYFLYDDLLLSQYLYYIKSLDIDYALYLDKMIEKMKEMKGCRSRINDFYIQYAKVLKIKWNLPLLIRSAYKKKDKDTLKELIATKILPLKEELTKLVSIRRKIWLEEFKPSGLEVLEQRFGAMIYRLDSVILRLEEFIVEANNNIPELEESVLDPTLNYEVDGKRATFCARALNIMTPNSTK